VDDEIAAQLATIWTDAEASREPWSAEGQMRAWIDRLPIGDSDRLVLHRSISDLAQLRVFVFQRRPRHA